MLLYANGVAASRGLADGFSADERLVSLPGETIDAAPNPTGLHAAGPRSPDRLLEQGGGLRLLFRAAAETLLTTATPGLRCIAAVRMPVG